MPKNKAKEKKLTPQEFFAQRTNKELKNIEEKAFEVLFKAADKFIESDNELTEVSNPESVLTSNTLVEPNKKRTEVDDSDSVLTFENKEEAVEETEVEEKEEVKISYSNRQLSHETTLFRDRRPPVEQTSTIYELIQDYLSREDTDKSISAINKKISKKLHNTVYESVKDKVQNKDRVGGINNMLEFQKLIKHNTHITNEEDFLNILKALLTNKPFRDELRASDDIIENPEQDVKLLQLNNKIKQLIRRASYKHMLQNKLEHIKNNKELLKHELKEELKISLRKMNIFLQNNKDNPYKDLLEIYEKTIRSFYKDNKDNLSNSKHFKLIELTYRLIFLAKNNDHSNNKPDGANILGIQTLATQLESSSCFKRYSDADLDIQSIIDDIVIQSQAAQRPSV